MLDFWKFLLCLGCAVSVSAWAHEGEDHGVTAEVIGQTLEPRFEAKGERAELTGILGDRQLWLFAGDPATNAPLQKLRIEVEGAGTSAMAQEKAPGVYQIEAKQLARPGRHAITLTVQGEAIEELLTGELNVAGESSASHWPPTGWMVAAGGALALLLGGAWMRRRKRA